MKAANRQKSAKAKKQVAYSDGKTLVIQNVKPSVATSQRGASAAVV